MRLILFFDLPTTNEGDMREYRKFRKFLIQNGFIMMQESVYSRIALNNTTMETLMNNIRKNKPRSGLVQTLSITEKQFSKMEFISGGKTLTTIDSDERLVII